jgi:hypothetical protein
MAGTAAGGAPSEGGGPAGGGGEGGQGEEDDDAINLEDLQKGGGKKVGFRVLG